jgi:hypothetical protein
MFDFDKKKKSFTDGVVEKYIISLHTKNNMFQY